LPHPRTSSKAERIREYLDTENVPELTVDELALIETTGRKLHKRFFVSSDSLTSVLLLILHFSPATGHPSKSVIVGAGLGMIPPNMLV